MDVDSSSAGKSAKQTRRAELRSRAWEREQRRSWTRPLGRTHRAIDATFGLISDSRQLILESELCAATRPVRATRRLERVSRMLSKASKVLVRAASSLRVTTDKVEQVQEFAQFVHDAPQKLIGESFRFARAAGELAVLSNMLDHTLASVVESVTSGAVPIPVEEQTEDPSKETIVRRVSTPCLPPELLLLDKYLRPCIPTRRRPACPAFAEADRRIFRGRAPPLLSTCSL